MHTANSQTARLSLLFSRLSMVFAVMLVAALMLMLPAWPEAQRGGFWSYVAGTAYRLLVSHQISGLVLDNHRTTLPMSKGLSSSAAICVMVSRRCALYNG